MHKYQRWYYCMYLWSLETWDILHPVLLIIFLQLRTQFPQFVFNDVLVVKCQKSHDCTVNTFVQMFNMRTQKMLQMMPLTVVAMSGKITEEVPWLPKAHACSKSLPETQQLQRTSHKTIGDATFVCPSLATKCQAVHRNHAAMITSK